MLSSTLPGFWDSTYSCKLDASDLPCFPFHSSWDPLVAGRYVLWFAAIHFLTQLHHEGTAQICPILAGSSGTLFQFNSTIFTGYLFHTRCGPEHWRSVVTKTLSMSWRKTVDVYVNVYRHSKTMITAKVEYWEYPVGRYGLEQLIVSGAFGKA